MRLRPAAQCHGLQDRAAILALHARNMPLADGVDLVEMAADCRGFTGADLAALCREAAMHALSAADAAGAARCSCALVRVWSASPQSSCLIVARCSTCALLSERIPGYVIIAAAMRCFGRACNAMLAGESGGTVGPSDWAAARARVKPSITRGTFTDVSPGAVVPFVIHIAWS